MAYCLLGIFDVDMPLLYGEGTKAFIQLQEEIIRRSDDEPIFAWSNEVGDPAHQVGMLAHHVRCFRGSASIVKRMERPKHPYSITNSGLHMQLDASRPIGFVANMNTRDESCLLHTIVLDGITFEPEHDIGQNLHSAKALWNIQRPIKYLILECLHGTNRRWYRSGSGGLIFRGKIHHDTLFDRPFNTDTARSKPNQSICMHR